MQKMTLAEKYGCYKAAVEAMGSFLLDCEDEELEYRLFEELDGDCTSFFGADFLTELLAADLIDEDIFCITRKIAVLYDYLENNTPKTADAVRASREWREALLLCDKIRVKLK